MNNKTKYSPVRLAIIIGIGFILFLVFGILYRQNNYTETWVICEFPDKYDNYEETLKFRYKKDFLYGYYREETFIRETDIELEEDYEYFKNIAADLETNKHFSYDVIKEENKLKVKTYIGVNTLPAFFDNYMKDKNIDSTTKHEQVKKILEKENYSCKLTYK